MSYTYSPVIAQFQLLNKDKDGIFPWAQMLGQREMRFVYDMMASVEASKDFTMTPAQAQLGLRILHKLNLSRKHWAADQNAESKNAFPTSEKKKKGYPPSGPNCPPPSQRAIETWRGYLDEIEPLRR